MKWLISITKLIGKIRWEKLKKLLTGREYDLTKDEQQEIWRLLSQKNLVILTWRSSHLSSYFISIGHFLLELRIWVLGGFKGSRPKFGRWSHSLINIEDTDTPRNPDDFILIESIGKGVTVSNFEDVFNCDRVCLLEPVTTGEPWQAVAEKALAKIGTPYDYEFRVYDDSQMSCVEFALYMIEQGATNPDDFKALFDAVQKLKNIDPQVFRDSRCFKVVYESGAH